jgi:hypothetical protein
VLKQKRMVLRTSKAGVLAVQKQKGRAEEHSQPLEPRVDVLAAGSLSTSEMRVSWRWLGAGLCRHRKADGGFEAPRSCSVPLHPQECLQLCESIAHCIAVQFVNGTRGCELYKTNAQILPGDRPVPCSNAWGGIPNLKVSAVEGSNRVTAQQNCFLKEFMVGSADSLRSVLSPVVAVGETAEQSDAARLQQNRLRQSRPPTLGPPTSHAYDEAADLGHTTGPTSSPTGTAQPIHAPGSALHESTVANRVNNSDWLTDLQAEAVEAAKAAEAALARAKAAAAAVKQAKRDAEALIEAANQEASAAMQNMQEATHKAGIASEAAAPSGSSEMGASAVAPGMHTVASVLAVRGPPSRLEYLVRWRGYEPAQITPLQRSRDGGRGRSGGQGAISTAPTEDSWEPELKLVSLGAQTQLMEFRRAKASSETNLRMSSTDDQGRRDQQASAPPAVAAPTRAAPAPATSLASVVRRVIDWNLAHPEAKIEVMQAATAASLQALLAIWNLG